MHLTYAEYNVKIHKKLMQKIITAFLVYVFYLFWQIFTKQSNNDAQSSICKNHCGAVKIEGILI